MFVKKTWGFGENVPPMPPLDPPMRIPEWLCQKQDWGLVCWGSHVWCECPEFCVAAAQCCCARAGRWKAKSFHSLTDRAVLQQLIEQQDITVICTIHFHPWMHENHISAPAPGDTNWNNTQEHVYQKPVRDVNELNWSSVWLKRGQQPAELQWSSDWSVARLA